MSREVSNPGTGGALERDAPALPSGLAGEPRTGVKRDGNGSDSRAALRDDLTRLIDKVGLTPFEVEDWRLDELAGRLLTAGWRRLVEDDDTIARLAGDLHAEECGCGDFDEHLAEVKSQFDEDDDDTYHRMARVVVRALREDT